MNTSAPRHHLHSPLKRGLYSFVLVAAVLAIGTVGIHRIEHFSFVDSFFYISMIATGQGPVGSLVPVTAQGKLFTAVIAFISVGSVVAAFGFLFGPFFGRLWRIGVIKLEEEIQHIQKKG